MQLYTSQQIAHGRERTVRDLRLYFDKDCKQSKRVQYCGIALIGFDADYYPSEGSKGVADEIAAAARDGLENIKKNIGNRLKEEKLDQIEIEMLCIPLPSAEGSQRKASHVEPT